MQSDVRQSPGLRRSIRLFLGDTRTPDERSVAVRNPEVKTPLVQALSHFDRTTSMPIPLRSIHLRRSRERERVEAHPLAHARGHSPTEPKPGSVH